MNQPYKLGILQVSIQHYLERCTAHLWRAIDALPDKLRIVVVLSAIEGHDVREVAALLRLPEGTVKSRLFLARKGLAEKLNLHRLEVEAPHW